MNRSTQIWAGVVVLAALSGAVYFKAKEDAKIGTSETTSAEVPEIKAPDDVDKVSIKNGDKPEVVLEKRGDNWMVVQPIEAPANQESMKSLVSNLKEIKTKEAVVAQPSEETKKEYLFEPSKEVHVVAYKGGEKKLDITFGKSGARGQLAMIEGHPGIYSVTGYSSYLYAKELKGFRDTEIFKFDDANANQVTIENKNGTFSFTKDGDKWAGTFKGKPIARFDAEKVKDLLRSFKSLAADDFGDGKQVAETGLDQPEGKITIQLKDNAGKYVLSVGKVSTGTNRWAQKEGSDTVYSMLGYQADWVTADASKFQQPADGGASTAAAAPPSDPHGGAEDDDPHMH